MQFFTGIWSFPPNFARKMSRCFSGWLPNGSNRLPTKTAAFFCTENYAGRRFAWWSAMKARDLIPPDFRIPIDLRQSIAPAVAACC